MQGCLGLQEIATRKKMLASLTFLTFAMTRFGVIARVRNLRSKFPYPWQSTVGAILLSISFLLPFPVFAEIIDVQVIDHEFVPRNITIAEGDTVRWTWGSDNHNVVAGKVFNPNEIFRSTVENTGFVFEQNFSRQFLNSNPVANNVYDYHCEPHAAMDMAGTITVIRQEKPLKATLTSWQSVPKTISNASGVCEGELNDIETELTLTCTNSVANPITAQLREAFIGSNGDITCELGSSGKGTFTCSLNNSQVDTLLNGGMYVSINTEAYPNGEIRGQVVRGAGSQSISGRVTDSTNSGISGVIVSDGIRSAETNNNGNYTLTEVPNGVYQLTATKVGFVIAPDTSVSPVVVNNTNLINRHFSVIGTNPLDGDNVNLTYPATGTWNGYNQQLNVLECNNDGTQSASFQIVFRDGAGTLVGTHSLLVPAKGTTHSILGSIFSTENNYGTFTMTPFSGFDAGANTTRCLVAVYRLSPSNSQNFEYSYVLPIENSTRGISAGTFNSMNPAGRAEPVFNWLSIYNTGNALFSATVKVYLIDGTLHREFNIDNLGPLNRIDYALGHNETEFNGQIVGLYEIIPNDLSAPYGAFVTRYGALSDGSFAYAFPSIARGGTCDSFKLFASTMNPAVNWLELGNVTDIPVNISLTIRNNQGESLGNRQVTLDGYQQTHILLNDYLGERNTGTVNISCSNQGSRVFAQGLVYGRVAEDPSNIAWAYATQRNPVGSPTLKSIVPINTYLNMSNWLKVLNTSSSEKEFGNIIIRGDGAELSRHSFNLASNTARDIGIHESTGADAVGLTSISLNSGSFVSELIRVLPNSDGTIGYITRVPASLVPSETTSITPEQIISGLSFPIALTHAGDSSDRLFIVEQGGLIKIYDGTDVLETPFLDVSDKISLSGEQGLLGLAFHPNYSSNGRFFVHYNGLDGETVIAEYQVSQNSNVANANSEEVILTVTQPDIIHNGGQIAFGSDGYLYVALGDGGPQGDPNGNAQNLNSLLGKILRIDINSGNPYAIPSTNPFISQSDARDEIWAYGFRNPWKFSFDKTSGKLFLGDVGQSAVEEVDIVTSGGNYGWNIAEGSRCYEPTEGCDTAGVTMPVAEYSHFEGFAIVGGYVYRGSRYPERVGKYFFGDFAAGTIWTLTQADTGQWIREEILKVDFQISSFGEDEDGELYVIDIRGKVYRL